LEKNDEEINYKNTRIIHHHDVISYCYYVKPNEDIPAELLEKYNIATGPIIFRGNSNVEKGDVAKKFMEGIAKLHLK